MNDNRPIIGITMGDPVGIGPEITAMALANQEIYQTCRPVVIGDEAVMKNVIQSLGLKLDTRAIQAPESGIFKPGTLDIITISNLQPQYLTWGQPTPETGKAMVDYIEKAISLAIKGDTAAVVTSPISKVAMKLGKSEFHGHTELLAARTGCKNFCMMMAGDKLRIVLVTIHTALSQVPSAITRESVIDTITTTYMTLKGRFGIKRPRIAVAGLNPHAGEEGLFGNEEIETIIPAVKEAASLGIDVQGPFPADTIYIKATAGHYDAVVSMYHDQGLIPFKMVHFEDGVNTTIGLPIIRTSVDHGTAYDIAGTGKANPESLIQAVNMASEQATNQINLASAGRPIG